MIRITENCRKDCGCIEGYALYENECYEIFCTMDVDCKNNDKCTKDICLPTKNCSHELIEDCKVENKITGKAVEESLPEETNIVSTQEDSEVIVERIEKQEIKDEEN